MKFNGIMCFCGKMDLVKLNLIKFIPLPIQPKDFFACIHCGEIYVFKKSSIIAC